MKAMVLAAGKGTRLFPLTGEVPKPMAPVVDRPIIEHIFELLADAGTEEVHVNVYYLADALLKAYGERSRINGMQVNLSREEELMGTAGGVKRLADNFQETFVVIMGDALTDVNLQELLAFHKQKDALATIALMRVSDTSEYGVVEVDEKGNILGFQEKPEPQEAISTLANTGIYVLEPEALEYIPQETFYDFARDVFPRLLEAGERFCGYEGEFYWSDIGNLAAYRQAQYDVLTGKVGVRIPGERRDEGLWVGHGSWVHSSIALQGRAVIGRETVIRSRVTIAGDVMVGDSCRVGPGASLNQSILLPGSSIGAGASLENCIVGPGYEVRPGERIKGSVLICRNRRGQDSLLRSFVA